MRLAIDAMGNDQGCAPIIEGVAAFLRDDADAVVVLVGDEAKLRDQMSRHGLIDSPRVEIVHASQVMEMNEKVSMLREKKDSSIFRLVQTVKEGKADAMVALGNTAAAVGAATLGLKTLKGVRRSGIAVPMPARHGACVVIDMGANTAVKAEHLMDYGVMASIYCEKVLHQANPRVGLLNVGEEHGKGNDLLRTAFEMLQQAPINFIGNVEGGDIFAGTCDVVVCDGFVGNVVLKASETLARTVTDWLRDAVMMSWMTKLGALLSKPAYAVLKRRISPATYGGAPLLGVNGICIIGHGRSSPYAVQNALRVAKESASVQLNRLIREAIEPFAELKAKARADREAAEKEMVRQRVS